MTMQKLKMIKQKTNFKEYQLRGYQLRGFTPK